jgi:hypothetical protein
MKTSFPTASLTNLILFSAAGVLTTSGLAQSNFTRVTNTVLTAQSISGAGAAWADYDGDGRLDLAQANYDGPNLLFHNNLDGTFTQITTNGVAIAGPESYGVSWGDFDNDGRPDLFFGNGYDTGIRNLLFHNGTNGNFVPLATGPGSSSLTGHSSGCAWADYDRDGWLDLFVANSDEPSYLWHNQGNGTFQRVLAGAVVTNVANSVGAAWADYDHDGWPDLLVANGFNESGHLFLYHNNRDGTLTRVTDGPIANDFDGFAGVAWGDYDNDGFLDLFVTVSNGHNYLYHNDGGTNFTWITDGDIVTDTGTFTSAAWADYDNDGWLDLFVGNRADGASNLLYHNNGDGTFTKVTSGPIVEDSVPNGGCAWGDYDNDGFPDLFVSVFGGNSLLYHNERTTNNWLKIILHPTKSNASAIGAKVRVTAIINGSAVTQIREINTGDGLGGNSQEALFGLGDTNAAVSVSIEWPSGALSSSPARVPGWHGTQDIWEPQPVSLRILGIARSPNQTNTLTLKLTDGDPTDYYVSGTLSTGLTLLHRAYAIESSQDMVHWTRYGGDSTYFFAWPPDWTDTYEVSMRGGPWFIRGRDIGFVYRFITP